jgi:hypothetical protein
MSGSEQARPSQAPPAEQHSVLLNLLPHVLQTFRREPALAITLCYLLVAMAGIFYNYSFYREFGIPILSLSQIGDFLVAGIQRPMALLLVLSTFPICGLLDTFNTRRRRKHALRREQQGTTPGFPSNWQRWVFAYHDWRYRQNWFLRVGYLVVIVLYGWSFVAIYASHRADAAKRGEGAQVAVWLTGDAGGLLPEQAKSWTYLGAVANYVFVYDPVARRSVALPINNIARLEPVPDPRAADSASAVAPIR